MKKQISTQEVSLKAWVVFCRNSDIWWLRFFKRGFKHCFLILNDGCNWITYDPMSAFTEISVQKTPISFNLPEWFSKRGDKVVPSIVEKRHKVAPVSLFTCVEGVKRVLGIHDFWILTPHQLYKHLTKFEEEIITTERNC
jgi:hypothetical protein